VAAFGTLTPEYSDLYNAVLKDNGDISGFFNKEGEKSTDPTSGAISWRITTAVVPVSLTAGTIIANNSARTVVALTAFERGHAIQLGPGQTRQFKDPTAMASEVIAFADGMNYVATGLIIAALVAATPVVNSTLAAGGMNFKATDATTAGVAMGKLEDVLTYVQVNTQGKTDQICLICSTNTYGGLRKADRLLGVQTNNLNRQNGKWYFQDYPIFATPYTTGIDGASASNIFVCHKDCLALCWDPLEWPDDGEFKNYGDGFKSCQILGYGYYGVTQATHCGEVLSTTS